MAREGQRRQRAETAPHPGRRVQARLPGRHRASRAGGTPPRRRSAEFQRDQCTDLAAALTYYSVLSVFPAILALVSLLGAVRPGRGDDHGAARHRAPAGPGPGGRPAQGPDRPDRRRTGAGLALVVGLAGAIWSASGYVGAFGRAMNRVYQVDEGRPIWKLRPVVLLITVGPRHHGGARARRPRRQRARSPRPSATRWGSATLSVTIWDIVKWPVMLGIVIVMVAVLYYATPNVRQPKFRWVSVGAAVAILIWVLASVAFGFYVSQLQLVQQDLRLARGRHRLPPLAVDHQPRPAVRCRDRRRARAGPPAAGRHRGRAHPAAAAARHPQLREGRGEAASRRSPRAAQLRLERPAGRRRGRR